MRRIALTGGPGGGKTMALAHARRKLEEEGRRVAVVPEAARILLEAVGRPRTRREVVEFQKAILQTQIFLEKTIERLFKKVETGTVTVITDRGVGDGRSFVSKKSWKKILQAAKASEGNLLRERYDAVLHLTTAADGAPEHYVNDQIRTENVNAALKQDLTLKQVYQQHPNHHVIENKQTFEEKLDECYQIIQKILRSQDS